MLHIKTSSEDRVEIWKNLVTPALCPDQSTYERFLERVQQGALTRDEDPGSHFCVYFLPINPETREVFIVHHKKSGLWISPGGHLDKGETPEQAVNREIEEELGIENFFSQRPIPFFFSTVDIDNPKHPCKRHHDLWYLMQTDGSAFHIDPMEFHETRWVTIDEAKKLVTDPSNLQALERI